MQVSITETLRVSPVTHIAPLRFLVRWGDVGEDMESRISEEGEEQIDRTGEVSEAQEDEPRSQGR